MMLAKREEKKEKKIVSESKNGQVKTRIRITIMTAVPFKLSSPQTGFTAGFITAQPDSF